MPRRCRMERRTFSKEFKQEAVQLSYESESTVAQVAEHLGIRAELLYRWRGEVQRSAGEAFPGNGKLKPQDAETARLRRELEQVRMERDILKKALSVFAQANR
jgi:transposase